MKTQMITLKEWAGMRGIIPAKALYYATRDRIDGQVWSEQAQRWEVPVDAPLPAMLKRGPKRVANV